MSDYNLTVTPSTDAYSLSVSGDGSSLGLTLGGPAGPSGPAGAAGPNSVTSATSSDGTADLSVATLTLAEPLPIESGGTGAITPSAARTELGLTNGSASVSLSYLSVNNDVEVFGDVFVNNSIYASGSLSAATITASSAEEGSNTATITNTGSGSQGISVQATGDIATGIRADSVSGFAGDFNSVSGIGLLAFSETGTGAVIDSSTGDHLNVGSGKFVVANDGTVSLTTPLPITSGGTGGATASTARTALGLDNGTAELSIAGLTSTFFRSPAGTTLNLKPAGGNTGVVISGSGTGSILLQRNSDTVVTINNDGLSLTSLRHLSWSNDLYLHHDAANTLAQRNGTNAQTFRLYNTYTSSTNFERLNFRWDANVAKIGTEKGSAGGLARDLVLETDGTERVRVTAAGAFRTSVNTQTPSINLVDGLVQYGPYQGGRLGGLDWKAASNSGLMVFVGNFAHYIFLRNSDGNVGIGTTTPASKLDVVGNITASDSITANSLALTTPLPITSGGTGGNTSSAARTNLQVYPSVTNIEAGLNFPLSVTAGENGQAYSVSGSGDITIPAASTLPSFRFRVKIEAFAPDPEFPDTANFVGAVVYDESDNPISSITNYNGWCELSTEGGIWRLRTSMSGSRAFTGTQTFATPLSIASGGTGGNTASTARTALGLGTAAQINAILGNDRRITSADVTRNNTTTFADDSTLVFPVEANTWYLIEFALLFTCTINSGFKARFSHPALATQASSNGRYMWPNNTGDLVSNNPTTTTFFSISAARNVAPVTGFSRVRIGETGGNLALQWAQNASHADNSTLLAGSLITVTKL